MTYKYSNEELHDMVDSLNRKNEELLLNRDDLESELNNLEVKLNELRASESEARYAVELAVKQGEGDKAEIRNLRERVMQLEEDWSTEVGEMEAKLAAAQKQAGEAAENWSATMQENELLRKLVIDMLLEKNGSMLQ